MKCRWKNAVHVRGSPVYTSAARQDFADLLAYIARDKPQAAVGWVEKIEAKCRVIAEQPAMGELQRQLGNDWSK